MNKDHFNITFKEDSEFNVSELTEYISLINAVVEVLEQRFPEFKDLTEITDAETEKVRPVLRSLSPIEWSDYVKSARKSNIGIYSISKNSPLEITICGSIILVTLALILSGGEISYKGFKVQLPSLGEGLKSLREALLIGKKIEITFGVQNVTIKLNEKEMNLLMQQDPSTERKGGFQKYLIGLQYRANKTTREIMLDQRDIDKIKRLKKDPSRGGFQGRFNKIFGRHI